MEFVSRRNVCVLLGALDGSPRRSSIETRSKLATGFVLLQHMSPLESIIILEIVIQMIVTRHEKENTIFHSVPKRRVYTL